MKQKNKNYSERQLLKDLASMREEVAAPHHFRSKIIAQLARETGQAAPQASDSLWQRLAGLLAQPRFLPVAAAACVLGIGLWVATRPAGQGELPVAPAVSAPAAASAVAAKPAVVASLPRAAKHTAVQVASLPKPVAMAAKAGEGMGSEQLQQASSQQAPAAGSAASAAPATQNKFTGVLASQSAPAPGPSFSGSGGSSSSSVGAAVAKPTIVVIEPTATPIAKGLERGSQVRRNRFLASKGEYAAILFKLKAPGHVRIECYDRNGVLVSVIHEGEHTAGTFEIRWYGHNDAGALAASGIYLIRVKTDEFDERHKVVLVK